MDVLYKNNLLIILTFNCEKKKRPWLEWHVLHLYPVRLLKMKPLLKVNDFIQYLS